MNSATIVRHLDTGLTCCDGAWEQAYREFETPVQEIAKFTRRLRRFQIDRLPAETRAVELFCGRGGGLHALKRLGLTNIEGVDLSETLLQQYRGPAKLHLADCRELPLADHVFDLVTVQGGLHHLPTLPQDLSQVLAEIARVLKPAGMVCVVEPWLTPFLRFTHLAVENPIVQKFYRKGAALASMIEHERETYERWLSQPKEILASFDEHFETIWSEQSWGKLMFKGRPARR